VEGSQVSCPWHNYTFDVTTGENVVNAELKVPCYDVKLEDGRVFVKVE
jgi:nitrite reductase/ring-hydroxylating ferredoxin subunit